MRHEGVWGSRYIAPLILIHICTTFIYVLLLTYSQEVEK
jgi:hypothetical protein